MFKEDIRLTGVVAKIELRKYYRGRKIILVLALIVAMLALTYAVQELTHAPVGDANHVFKDYAMAYPFVLLLFCLLFATSLVSGEFEDNTHLMLFTRPIKKWSMYFGKYLGCLIVAVCAMGLYFLGAGIITLAIKGTVPIESLVAFGFLAMETAAYVAIAMLFSTVFKKSVTATILMFFVFAMIIPLVDLGMKTAGIDAWWFIETTEDIILKSVLREPLIQGLTVANAIFSFAMWMAIPAFIGYKLFKRKEA